MLFSSAVCLLLSSIQLTKAAATCKDFRKCRGTRDCPDSATICASADLSRQLFGDHHTHGVELGICVCPSNITGPHKIRYPCATDEECVEKFIEPNLQCMQPSFKCCSPLPSGKTGYCRRPAKVELADDAEDIKITSNNTQE